MQGDKAIIRLLNAVLTNELTAVNQYFLHARMFESWGLRHLGQVIYDESIGEMKHADKLIKRILFLDGLPNLQNLGKLRIGENPEEVLRCDLALEMDGLPLLREAIAYCETANDYVSRKLFADILESEEEHVDWIETQLDLVERVGEQNYLQSKIDD